MFSKRRRFMYINVNGHDAAVIFIFGQSNAHGHAIIMNDDEIIKEPMKNVFGLSADKNQAYDLDEVVFDGYSSYGKNLGEDQDCTNRLATFLAKMWQAEIDSGNKMGLPDLYIVQISIGAQGTIKAYFWTGGVVDQMWKPDRPRVMKPGPGDKCDISLYPLAQQTIENTMKYLHKNFKNPVSLGLHWIGSEGDTAPFDPTFFDHATDYYEEFFKGLRGKTDIDCPLYFYELCNNQKNCDKINAAFRELADRDSTVHIVETSKTPEFGLDKKNRGIFIDDGLHYKRETHRWFAQRLFDSIK